MTRFARPEAVVFLLLESSDHPMALTGVRLFRPPEGAGPEFAREIYEAMRAFKDIDRAGAGHPAPTRRGTSILRWTYDDDFDVDYHLRYTVLPAPGRMRELFALAGDLHSRLLDRRKPLFEVHVIDGLEDGRFAFIVKGHHALGDAVVGAKLMDQTLSADPADRQMQVTWAPRPSLGDAEIQVATRRERAGGKSKSLARVGRSLSVMRTAPRNHQLMPVMRAPKTIFNGPSGGPRRVAGQSWPLERAQNIASVTGVTFNDVCLAMSAGSLRAYLAERNALPDVPLVAMVPVTLRNETDDDANNMIGGALCNLATDLEDPGKRLETISASMRYNIEQIRELPRQLALHLAGVICAPISGGTGVSARIPPMFNLFISHVRGSREPLYKVGARVEATYGFIPTMRGRALSFGLFSGTDSVDFGICGSAAVVPDPARLLGHLETALKDLERAVGL